MEAIHFYAKECTRLWLRITNIKAERLHDISEADIKKEGIRIPVNSSNGNILIELNENCALEFLPKGRKATSHEILFAYWAELWCKINGRKSWDQNPWVWVIEFEQTIMPVNFLK